MPRSGPSILASAFLAVLVGTSAAVSQETRPARASQLNWQSNFRRNQWEPSGGRIWHVGHGGDFTDIQSAIDAATDGDVILVDPGDYAGFALSKRLVIRSTSAPFTVLDPTIVANVAAGPGVAAISGMTFNDIWVLVPLTVSDCSGEVVLEDVSLPFDWNSYPALVEIERCANVAVDALTMNEGSYLAGDGLEIVDSSVRVSDSVLHGSIGAISTYDAGPPFPATPALNASGSFVVVARSDVFGGNGAWGYDACYTWASGADGGPAILASDSVVIVEGTEQNVIQGGNGGSFYPQGCWWHAKVGDGAPGMTLTNCSVTLSRVTAAGGFDGNGKNQAPAWTGGSVLRDDRYALLTSSADARIGGAASISVDASEPSDVLLLMSDQGGFADPGSDRIVGPPLSIAVDASFAVLPLGRTDASGDLTLPGSIPNDPALVGFPLHLQAVAFGDSGIPYLTNAVERVIGQ